MMSFAFSAPARSLASSVLVGFAQFPSSRAIAVLRYARAAASAAASVSYIAIASSSRVSSKICL